MRKEHGQRNLNLCNDLLTEGQFNDWVVTTAFYSSVHFVEHALFPLVEHRIEYADFNEYWQELYYPRRISKHNCKVQLVSQHIRSVRTIYRELLDDCGTARYNNYVVTDYNATQAKIKAERIKAACLAIKA